MNTRNRHKERLQTILSLFEKSTAGFTDEDFIAVWNSLQFPDPESLPIQFDPQRDGN